MESKYFEISKLKGEIPLYVLLFVTWLFTSMVIYPYGGHFVAIYLVVLVLAVFLMKKMGGASLNKKYYIQADATGIAYNTSVFRKETKLIWELVEHVEVFMYEINFTLKSNGTVTSLSLSVLDTEEEKDELKKFVYQSYNAFKKANS